MEIKYKFNKSSEARDCVVKDVELKKEEKQYVDIFEVYNFNPELLINLFKKYNLHLEYIKKETDDFYLSYFLYKEEDYNYYYITSHSIEELFEDLKEEQERSECLLLNHIKQLVETNDFEITLKNIKDNRDSLWLIDWSFLIENEDKEAQFLSDLIKTSFNTTSFKNFNGYNDSDWGIKKGNFILESNKNNFKCVIEGFYNPHQSGLTVNRIREIYKTVNINQTFSSPKELKDYIRTIQEPITFIAESSIDDVLMKEWLGEWEYKTEVKNDYEKTYFTESEKDEEVAKEVELHLTARRFDDEYCLDNFDYENEEIIDADYCDFKMLVERTYLIEIKNRLFKFYATGLEIVNYGFEIDEVYVYEIITEEIVTNVKTGSPKLNPSWTFKIEQK